MNQRKKLHDNTEKEVSLWRLLGLTLPFVGMTAIIMCVLFANNYVVPYSCYCNDLDLLWCIGCGHYIRLQEYQNLC